MIKFSLPLLLLILASNMLFAQLSFYDEDPIYEGPQSNFYLVKYAISYDYNNDGISDILHIQHNRIYVRYGDGSTFGNEELVYEHSSMLASISNKLYLNSDNRLDFAIPSVNNEILIFEGTADGIELSATIEADANTVKLIDFDKDGHIGIVYTTGFEIGYIDGNELGTFDDPISITSGIGTIAGAFRFEVVDIDGDSDNDLFILDMNNSLVHVVQNEDFSFTSNTSVSASETEFSYGDYNLDGFIDLAVINSSNSLEIYLQGDTGYDLSYTYSTFNIRDIITYDYNSDGKKDILLSNRMTDLTLLKNLGDGTFDDPEFLISEMPRFSNHSFEDFNDDGIDDIVAIGTMANNQVILVPLDPQVKVSDQFTTLSLRPDPGTRGGTKMSDLDNDGYNDLVIFSKNGAVQVFYGNETGLNNTYSQYTTNTHTDGGYLADIDDDGLLDLIVFYQSASNGTVGTERYLNLGNRTFSDAEPFKYTAIVEDAVVEDYDQDGTDNFIFNNHGEIVFLTVNENDFDEYFTGSPLKISSSSSITDFKIVDINHDSWSDLILGVNGSNEIEIHLNDQAGGFLSPTVITLTGESESPTALNAGDLDNDGIAEIIAATSTSSGHKTKIFSRKDVLNDFVLSREFDVASNYGPTTVEINDFDGDGDIDLFIDDFDNLVYTFILQHDDVWEVNDEILELFGQNLLIFCNVNSDNLIDIVRTQNTYGSVQVSINNSVFEPEALQTEIMLIEQVGESLKVSLNAINNDGRIVLVKAASEVDVTPVDGVFYAQNSTFGLAGTKIGSGNHVVYAGTENTFTINGLSPLIDYYVSIFEYNINDPSNDIINYLSTQSLDTVVARKVEQTFTAEGIQNYFVGDETFEINITSSSGLDVEIDITGPINLEGGTATILGEGEVILVASQAGNKYYFAQEETYTFSVSKEEQTLSATGIMNYIATDEPFQLKIVSSSGLDVQTEISGPISVQDDMATITGAGEVTIVASQEGNEFYLPLEETYTFTINKAEQTLTFQNLGDVNIEVGTFEIQITASSELPTSFSLVSGPIEINDGTATILGVGTVVIDAVQEGNDFYLSVEETFEFDIVEPLGLDLQESIIYPNPTSGVLRIANFHHVDELSIVDINGRVRHTNPGTERTLDVSGLERGTYFILLKSKGTLQSFRFIKE